MRAGINGALRGYVVARAFDQCATTLSICSRTKAMQFSAWPKTFSSREQVRQ